MPHARDIILLWIKSDMPTHKNNILFSLITEEKNFDLIDMGNYNIKYKTKTYNDKSYFINIPDCMYYNILC
jgi:hypothetical protein